MSGNQQMLLSYHSGGAGRHSVIFSLTSRAGSASGPYYLYDLAKTFGAYVAGSTDITVIIDANVPCVSGADGAHDTGGFPPTAGGNGGTCIFTGSATSGTFTTGDILTLINNSGYTIIGGGGGAGGGVDTSSTGANWAGANGRNGGDAISMDFPLTINFATSCIISGGGGGGGGGGAVTIPISGSSFGGQGAGLIYGAINIGGVNGSGTTVSGSGVGGSGGSGGGIAGSNGTNNTTNGIGNGGGGGGGGGGANGGNGGYAPSAATYAGGTGGTGGYAIRENGHTLTVFGTTPIYYGTVG